MKVVQGLKIGTWTQEQLFRSKHVATFPKDSSGTSQYFQLHLNQNIVSGFISIFFSGISQSSEPMLAPSTEESAVEESGFSILPSPP